MFLAYKNYVPFNNNKIYALYTTVEIWYKALQMLQKLIIDCTADHVAISEFVQAYQFLCLWFISSW